MWMTLLIAFLTLVMSHQGVTQIETALHSILASECSILFFGLNSDIIKGIMELQQGSLTDSKRFLVAFLTADNSAFRFTAKSGISECSTALSTSALSNTVQEVMLPTFKRQVLLLKENSSTPEVETSVHKFHHPLVLFSSSSDQIVQNILCRNGQLHTINIYKYSRGMWNFPFTIHSMSLEKICNKGYHPLQGSFISGNIFAIKPFLVINPETYEVIGGAVYDILRTIAEHYKFDYDIQFSHQVFIFYPNGTIGGALGELVYGQVDFSMEQALIVGSQFGTFTSLTYHIFFTYMEQKPKQLPRYMNIAYPLDVHTWVLLLVSLVSVWLVISAMYEVNLEGRYSQGLNLVSIFELTYGIMFQEYYESRKASKDRLFTSFTFLWVAVTTFITMAFTGNLKSSLVRKNYESRTMTLNEVVDKDMTVYMTDTMENYLASDISDSVINSRLLCQARKKNSVFPLGADLFTQMAQPVLDNGGSSIMYEQSIQVLKNSFLKEGKDFPLIVIPEWYMMMAQGVLFQKYDPRAQYFDEVIVVLKDCGLINYFFSKLMPPKGMKEHIDTEEEPLVMEHFYLPLIIWVIGLLLGLIGYIFEYYWLRDHTERARRHHLSMVDF